MSLRIFPATELHLLPGTAVDLQYAAMSGGQWTNFTTNGGITARLTPLPAFLTLTGRRLAASAAGQVLTRLVLNDGTNDFATAPVRIFVHRRLLRLFLPHSSIDLRENRSDRVLTVYGEFTDATAGTITADITSHPYLRYAPTVSSAASVHVGASGRVTTGPGAGNADVVVSVDSTLNQPAPPVTLTVRVAATVTDRPILDRFHTGTAVRKKGILFLPDGFQASEQTEFENLARDIGHRLLRAISPYRHLRESFDLYRAFVASAENGSSIGPRIFLRPGATDVGFSVPTDQPIANNAMLLAGSSVGDVSVLHHLGHPATSPAQTIAAARTQLSAALGTPITAREFPQALFDLWQSLRTHPPVSRLRETFFGLMVGERDYGTAALMEPTPPPAAPQWPPLDAAAYMARGAVRTVVFDERRLPDLRPNDPKTAHSNAFSAFVRTLRRADGPAGEGAIWAKPAGAGSTDGSSFGLVVILVRTDHYSGVLADGCLMMSIGPGMLHHVSASTIVPRLLEVVPVPRPIGAAHTRLGFNARPLDSIVDVVAHELGHSDALGGLADEYVDRGRADPTNVATATFAEQAPNAQLLANAVAGAGAGLHPARIKWNWERVDGAAFVEEISVMGNTIRMVFVDDQWFGLPSMDPGRVLTLRHSRLDRPHHLARVVGSDPAVPAPQALTVVSVDRVAQAIVCQVTGGGTPAAVVNTFPPGSVLLVPRLAAGAIVRIIPGPIAVDLAARGPFSPSSAQCQPAARPAARPIAGFRYPANQLHAVAAYEVGAGFACGAIRPSGECKMRTVVQNSEPPTEFCYVCKYAIANAVDPSVLPAIDREYP